ILYISAHIYLDSFPTRRSSDLDSSCVYKNPHPENQDDINKLYGFSDCTSLHHANSARFGWNWKDGALRIHAYCYVDSVRQYKELDRKSTRLNSSHVKISYAVFC